jgi:hypothetical protein
MSGFENYDAEIAAIEEQIIRKAIGLDVDWDNENEVRELAKQALAYHHTIQTTTSTHYDGDDARRDIFGLAQLMLLVMEKCAHEGMLAHAGPTWKIFAHALWAEKSNYS